MTLPQRRPTTWADDAGDGDEAVCTLDVLAGTCEGTLDVPQRRPTTTWATAMLVSVCCCLVQHLTTVVIMGLTLWMLA